MTTDCNHIRILFFFAFGWLVSVAAVAAAHQLELIQLQNRSAPEILPILKPHLEADEAMTGQGYQLILRATPERLSELKTLVDRLDQAQARLRISVRRADNAWMEAENRRLRGQIGVHEGNVDAQAKVKLYRTEGKASDGDEYVVNTLEGQPAFIAEGLAFPSVGSEVHIVNGRRVVTNHLEYRQLESGFYALARVNGGQVTVTVSPRREALSPQGGGRIETSAMTTTVRGPLGRWLQLGGVGTRAERQSQGTVYRTESKQQEQNQIWIKVDVINSD